MNRQATIFSIPMVLLFAVCATGCGRVNRQITITSEPEGAIVTLSDKEVGRTPVTIDYAWHGEYDVILRFPEKGYETLNTSAVIDRRWYDYPPLDLLVYLTPGVWEDHRYLHYKLRKLVPIDRDVLIKRAEELKRRNELKVR